MALNRPQLQRPDIDDKGDYASTLKGGLPNKKRKISPFDKIGSRQWQPQKGQVSKSYA